MAICHHIWGRGTKIHKIWLIYPNSPRKKEASGARVPKKPVLVPGKTPPDASGSRPDSQYGKSSDVVVHLSDRYVPRERCINQRRARRCPLRERRTEVLRRGFSRNQAFTVRAFLPIPDAPVRFHRCDLSAKRHRQTVSSNCGPTDPGGTGQPVSAALVKRRAYRPAFLP